MISRSTIGPGCVFGRGVRVFNSLLVGDIETLNYVSIFGPGTVLNAGLSKIEIGSYCSIAPGVKIIAYSHNIDYGSTYFIKKNLLGGSLSDDVKSSIGIKIGDDVWIGSNAVITDGVEIGRGCVIAAGSIVTKDIPSYSIAAGNPAVVLRRRFSNERISKLESSRWWEATGSDLEGYMELLSSEK